MIPQYTTVDGRFRVTKNWMRTRTFLLSRRHGRNSSLLELPFAKLRKNLVGRFGRRAFCKNVRCGCCKDLGEGKVQVWERKDAVDFDIPRYSIEVAKDDDLEYDIGNLMAYDTHAIDVAEYRFVCVD